MTVSSSSLPSQAQHSVEIARLSDLAALEHDVLDAGIGEPPTHSKARMAGADDHRLERRRRTHMLICAEIHLVVSPITATASGSLCISCRRPG